MLSWIPFHVMSKRWVFCPVIHNLLNLIFKNSNQISTNIIRSVHFLWELFPESKIVPRSLTEILDSLRWRHNGHDSVSNHQPHDCLPNRLFRRRSKKTSKLRVTGLCAVPGEFPAQMASYGEEMFPFDDLIMYYVCSLYVQKLPSYINDMYLENRLSV